MNKNVICWFEIYVKDLSRAKKFYSDVLGTNFHDAPSQGDAPHNMTMSFFTPMSDEGNYVSGALVQMDGTKEGDGQCVNTMIYFPCKDCSVEASRVQAAGGVLNRDKFSIGEYGYIAICTDSEGNPFGLFSME